MYGDFWAWVKNIIFKLELLWKILGYFLERFGLHFTPYLVTLNLFSILNPSRFEGVKIVAQIVKSLNGYFKAAYYSIYLLFSGRHFNLIWFFLNMRQSRPLFRLFSSFSYSHINYNFNNTNWKSIDGVLGIRTRYCKMVVGDETTELWWQPLIWYFCS